jgi:hypothetical protein
MLTVSDSAGGRAARRTIIARYAVAAMVAIALGLLLFQPAVANQFGYALPVTNGLPCRVHYANGTYDNDYQCAGANMTGWMTWSERQHHFPKGGGCLAVSAIQPRGGGTLTRVAQVSTLLGAAHPIVTGRGSYSSRSAQALTLYIQDGSCYRPYNLEIFP